VRYLENAIVLEVVDNGAGSSGGRGTGNGLLGMRELLSPSITRRLVEEFARRPAASEPRGLDDLTPRELDVLRLIAGGLSNAEIATALFIEPSTVKSHVASILARLGLRDRVQAVVAAYESGLVVADPS
jgi:DNA-binding NarL/FixJ family response regulator